MRAMGKADYCRPADLVSDTLESYRVADKVASYSRDEDPEVAQPTVPGSCSNDREADPGQVPELCLATNGCNDNWSGGTSGFAWECRLERPGPWCQVVQNKKWERPGDINEALVKL
jgi:hypothetical protein